MKRGNKHTEETKAVISESMKGKKNAEIWNEASVTPILQRFYDMVMNDKSGDFILINDLLVTEHLYKDIWSDWTDKFKENETISRLIKSIETVLEGNIYANAIKGKYNSTMAIFGLKNKYGWKDKTEIESNTKSEIAIQNPYEGLSFETIEMIEADLLRIKNGE